MKAPLAGYVLGTWCTMAFVVLCSAYSFVKADCSSPKPFCLAMAIIGLVHAAFAFYLQRRLVGSIGKENYKDMKFLEIAGNARQIMLYDVAFCFYVFVFFGSFGYACAGIGDLGDCVGTGPAWSAASILILYSLGVFFYAVCWYGCQSCCGGVESAVKRVQPGPLPTPIGAGK